MLVHPQDPVETLDQCYVVYSYTCMDCEKEYTENFIYARIHFNHAREKWSASAILSCHQGACQDSKTNGRQTLYFKKQSLHYITHTQSQNFKFLNF